MSVSQTRPKHVDLVVVGGGAAGLYCALQATKEGARVLLISARPLAQTASYWAQGGLAAALAKDDSPEIHLDDTLSAGRNLVSRRTAEVLCRDAPDRVHDLEELGVDFDREDNGDLALGLEGGHSRRRVIHAGGSATGRQILRTLSLAIRNEPGLEVREEARVSGLLVAPSPRRCVGVITDRGERIFTPATILATGGAAALWSRTTNPPGSYGSGIGLALGAGAKLADLEFVQFHPTAVHGIPGREGYLISEAIRGEGATLHCPRTGERFVDELQPRDVVARAIYERLKSVDASAAFLDASHIDLDRFPNVVEALTTAGLDPTIEPIPVAPAAHYTMGGIISNLDGRSTLEGLYAIGECSCTGLHGANRLASNSLSECFVFGRRAAIAALDTSTSPIGDLDEVSVCEGVRSPSTQTREATWKYAGLIRSESGLQQLSTDEHPLARLVARSALARLESRGAHQRVEFPDTDRAYDYQHTELASEGSVEFRRWD